MTKKDLRLNTEIDNPEVRLLSESSEQLGVVPISRALSLAEEAGFDLVEIAPQAKPPVCRIMDYGKYKFEQEKKIRLQKKQQKIIKLKEVRMQPKIDSHDINFKTKHIQSFLADGYKVKVTVRFKGREFAHANLLGNKVLDSVIAQLDEDSYTIDSTPKMEGRFMSMVLSNPTKKFK